MHTDSQSASLMDNATAEAPESCNDQHESTLEHTSSAAENTTMHTMEAYHDNSMPKTVVPISFEETSLQGSDLDTGIINTYPVQQTEFSSHQDDLNCTSVKRNADFTSQYNGQDSGTSISENSLYEDTPGQSSCTSTLPEQTSLHGQVSEVPTSFGEYDNASDQDDEPVDIADLVSPEDILPHLAPTSSHSTIPMEVDQLDAILMTKPSVPRDNDATAVKDEPHEESWSASTFASQNRSSSYVDLTQSDEEDLSASSLKTNAGTASSPRTRSDIVDLSFSDEEDDVIIVVDDLRNPHDRKASVTIKKEQSSSPRKSISRRSIPGEATIEHDQGLFVAESSTLPSTTTLKRECSESSSQVLSRLDVPHSEDPQPPVLETRQNEGYQPPKKSMQSTMDRFLAKSRTLSGTHESHQLNMHKVTSECDGHVMERGYEDVESLLFEALTRLQSATKRKKDSPAVTKRSKKSKSDAQKKPRKSQKGNKRARNPRDWHAMNRQRPTYKLRDRVWKEAQIQQLQDKLDGPKPKRKTAKPRKTAGFDISKLGPGQSIAFEQFTEQNKFNDDIHKLSKDKKQLKDDSLSFGLNRMKSKVLDNLEEGQDKERWQLEGMPTPLYNHQLIAVYHMVERECTPEAPHGLILADSMGLGKTLQAIATIIANPPFEEETKAGNSKTTLIVVPSSLRDQWVSELRKHAGQYGQNVGVFKRSDEHANITTLKNYNVVITTYWELAQSLPSPDRETRKKWKTQKVDFYTAAKRWAEKHPNKMGLLHKMEWYRVILDEGHMIKNHLSRASRAAVALRADRRHILSGTPIMNAYREFYPLLLFLREPITMELSPDEFLLNFGDSTDPLCRDSLSILLKDIIIHRNISDRLMGRELVSLPKSYKKIRKVPFRAAERILFLAISVRLSELLTVDMDKDDERKRLQNLLAQLLRLRQLVASPDLVGQQIVKMFTVEQLEDVRGMIQSTIKSNDKLDISYVLRDRVSMWIKDKIDGIYESLGEDDVECCQSCDDPSEDLFDIKCGHFFCEACIGDFPEEIDEDGNIDEERPCPLRKCGMSFKEKHVKRRDGIPQPKKKFDLAQRTIQSKEAVKGKDVRNFRPIMGKKQRCAQIWLSRFDNNEINILPSAKLKAVMEQILYWINRENSDQIIVFSQFRHFQILLGVTLQQHEIPFMYFSGDMNHKHRSEAIKYFTENNDIKVMVAGLKCGGIGLNLVAANRVLICDPWWNSCIDDQGFGRVYRIGQMKKTYLGKTIIKGSVDSKILDLQHKKESSIHQIMQDKLTVQEIQELLACEFDEWTKLLAKDDWEEEEELDDWMDDDDEDKGPPASLKILNRAGTPESTDSDDSDSDDESEEDTDGSATEEED